MPVDLLDLPSNAKACIFSYLNDTSLLRMREVCTSTKAVVNRSLKARTAEFTGSSEDKVEITFASPDLRRLTLFKLSFISGCNKLGNTVSSFKNFSGWCFNATMNFESMQWFLEYLKPFLHRTKCVLVYANQRVIKMIFDFLEGKSVYSISMFPRASGETTFIPSIEVISKVRTKKFHYAIQSLTNESIAFIMNLAETIQYITLYSRETFTFPVNWLLIIKEILSRKCDRLYIGHPFPPVSPSDAEELIQVPLYIHVTEEKSSKGGKRSLQAFHHMGKKIHFTTSTTSVDLIDAQIGVYDIKKMNTNDDTLVIKHMDVHS